MTVMAERDSSPRILVADDDPVNLLVLEQMLGLCGQDCDVARDGAECVAKAETGDYEMILMDIHMPKMDGVEAALEIARRMKHTAPKVVAVTANASASQRRECEEAGFTGFVTKPVRLEYLKEVLEEALA